MKATRVLVAVAGSFAGRVRVSRSTGRLDTEGVDRVLSGPSRRALALAHQLGKDGAELVVVHIDKGAGEEILREALAHVEARGVLVEGWQGPTDAGVRAATLAEIYRQDGPFDCVIGPSRSDFSGFTGTMAALAGALGQPCVHGAHSITRDGDGFRIGYASIFGDYDLRIPRPCVVIAGDVTPVYATTWGIARAYKASLLRVQAGTLASAKPRTTLLRIEHDRPEQRSSEEVDAATLVRRLRSRALIAEGRP